MAKRWFDCVLLIKVAAGADMVQVDVEWGDVVMVGKVLRLDSEDEHAALEVQPCRWNILLDGNIPILRTGVHEAVASHLQGGELWSMGYEPMYFVSSGGGVGYSVVVDARSEGGIKVVVSVKTGGVDRLAWIAHERTIVGCAAVSVQVVTADVEGAVIAGLQLCGSGDG